MSALQFFESENLSWFKYILEIYSAKPVGRHGDQEEVSPRPAFSFNTSFVHSYRIYSIKRREVY